MATDPRFIQRFTSDREMEARALYQRAGRIAGLGFWEWDEVTGNCTFCSEELARIHCVSVEEYLRRTTSNEEDRRWMHPDDRNRYELEAERFHKDHLGFEIEYRLLRADGQIAEVCEIVAPVVDDNGVLTHSFGFVKDITREKLAITENEKVADLFRETECLAKVGHWEWDEITDRCISCSEELARMCGLSVKEFLKQTQTFAGDIAMLHPDDRAYYAALNNEYSKAPARYQCEYRLFSERGRVIDVREVIVPIFDHNDVHIRSIGIVQDISESKKAAKCVQQARDDLEQRVLERTSELQLANDRLVENETRLRDATRIAKLGYFRWDAVAGNGIYGDAELASILGVPVAECMSESLREYLARVHRDDVGRVTVCYEDSYKEYGEIDLEYRIVRPDGNIRHVREISTPQFDEYGRLIQTFGTVQDITERKYMGQELELIERRLRELGTNAREVLYVLSADWRSVVYVNEAYEKIWGHSCQAVQDNPRLWFDSLHPDDRDTIQAELKDKKSGADLSPNFSDCRVVGSNGEVRWLSTRVYPIRDDDGVIVNVAGIVDDITERKAISDALHQAKKMDAVGQLTGGVAHDFNNLLAIILGNSELLQGRLVEEDDLLLQDIITAASRGAELTRRLLAFSRLQPLEPVVTDVVKLVADMGELLQRTLGTTISVENTSSCSNAKALVDPSLLENAILNLALNARDAMPDGGRLEIRVETNDFGKTSSSIQADAPASRELKIVVQDDGTGMDVKILSRALEPFFTTKVSGDGTGLGLPMVYGFAKQSKGDLLIDSNPGEGTTVTICLPLSRIR